MKSRRRKVLQVTCNHTTFLLTSKYGPRAQNSVLCLPRYYSRNFVLVEKTKTILGNPF